MRSAQLGYIHGKRVTIEPPAECSEETKRQLAKLEARTAEWEGLSVGEILARYQPDPQGT